MARRQFKFHNGESGAALAVRLKHAKKASGFVNVLRDGTVVIRLEKAQGDENTRLVEFLASALNIPQKQIKIVAGKIGDKKLISIDNLEPKLIQKMVLDLIP